MGFVPFSQPRARIKRGFSAYCVTGDRARYYNIVIHKAYEIRDERVGGTDRQGSRSAIHILESGPC